MSARDVGSIGHNIENVLLLGATQHIAALLETVAAWPEVLMLCVLVAAADHLATARRPALTASVPRQLWAQINVVVLSQTVFAQLASSSEAAESRGSLWQSVLALGQHTVVLIAVASIPAGAYENEYRARVESLVLFMYTENLEEYARRVRAPRVVLVLSVFAYAYMHGLEAWAARSQLRRYVARAVNMMAVNSVLQTVTASALSDATQTGLMLLVVLFLDVAAASVAMFAEFRAYALWKAARHVQQLYALELRDSAPVLASSCLLLVLVRRQSVLQRTASELLVLVSVNMLVRSSVPDPAEDRSLTGLVVLLVYVMVLRLFLAPG